MYHQEFININQPHLYLDELDQLVNYQDDVISFYRTNFDILFPVNTKPNIKVVSAAEMKKFEDSINQAAMNLLDEISKQATKLIAKYKKKINIKANNSVKHVYRHFIECLKGLLSINVTNYKKIIWECKSRLEDLKGACRELNENELANDINQIEKLLKSLCFMNNLYGCYVRNERTIYMCPDNIRCEAETKRMRFNDLLNSIFIHEYAHFLHHEYITQQQRNIADAVESVKRSAVFETIAEYCQMKHALETKNNTLIKWMEDHQTAGYFPGWGYGGAYIVQRAEHQLNISLIDEVIAKSKTSWDNAYNLIIDADLISSLHRHRNYRN